MWSGRLFRLNARAHNDSVRTHYGHLVQHTVRYGLGQRCGMGIMPLAMKVPFHQTTRCHTATDHVLTEFLLLLHAVLITYDPEEVASYYLPRLLSSSVLFISHYSFLSSRHNHFLKLFLSPCSSVYLLSSSFPFHLSIKTSLFLLFLRSFSFLFSTASSYFLYFFCLKLFHC